MNRRIAIAATVRSRQTIDEDRERRQYWLAQPMEARLLEVESLRQMSIGVAPASGRIERVVLIRSRKAPGAPPRRP